MECIVFFLDLKHVFYTWIPCKHYSCLGGNKYIFTNKISFFLKGTYSIGSPTFGINELQKDEVINCLLVYDYFGITTFTFITNIPMNYTLVDIGQRYTVLYVLKIFQVSNIIYIFIIFLVRLGCRLWLCMALNVSLINYIMQALHHTVILRLSIYRKLLALY